MTSIGDGGYPRRAARVSADTSLDPPGQRAPRRVKVRAPGKINAFFRVGPLREDGYHAVASTYLAVSLYEEVAATSKPGTPASDITVSASGLAVPLTRNSSPASRWTASNLAVRAALLVAEIAENPCGVHLEITKHVPIAGGMGGGSADAAAALRGLRRALAHRPVPRGAVPAGR